MTNTLILNSSGIILPHFNLKLEFNLRALWAMLFIFAIVLSAVYISQVVKMTEADYFIGTNEKKISKLAEENKNLEIALSKINSLNNLEILVKNLNFEQVGSVHYIRILESTATTK